MAWIAVLIVVALGTGVNGHGQLTVPRVRPDNHGSLTGHRQVEPVFTLTGPRSAGLDGTGYSATSMRCHDFGLDPSDATSQLQAGGTFDVTWTCEACHPGDCYLYLSYDADFSNPVNFFKIASFPGCGAPDGLDPPRSVTKSVTLPNELPSCDHCVLRWEWTAHQQVSNIEFYVNCADVTIQSDAPSTKPFPMTAIAGIEHLPANANEYRKVYQKEGPEEKFLVGPAIATFSSCSINSAGCIGSGRTSGTEENTSGGTGNNKLPLVPVLTCLLVSGGLGFMIFRSWKLRRQAGKPEPVQELE